MKKIYKKSPIEISRKRIEKEIAPKIHIYENKQLFTIEKNPNSVNRKKFKFSYIEKQQQNYHE